jgi:hypothetical protein
VIDRVGAGLTPAPPHTTGRAGPHPAPSKAVASNRDRRDASDGVASRSVIRGSVGPSFGASSRTSACSECSSAAPRPRASAPTRRPSGSHKQDRLISPLPTYRQRCLEEGRRDSATARQATGKLNHVSGKHNRRCGPCCRERRNDDQQSSASVEQHGTLDRFLSADCVLQAVELEPARAQPVGERA